MMCAHFDNSGGVAGLPSMKKWMMLLAGWLMLVGAILLAYIHPKGHDLLVSTGMQRGLGLVMGLLAIATGALILVDK